MTLSKQKCQKYFYFFSVYEIFEIVIKFVTLQICSLRLACYFLVTSLFAKSPIEIWKLQTIEILVSKTAQHWS